MVRAPARAFAGAPHQRARKKFVKRLKNAARIVRFRMRGYLTTSGVALARATASPTRGIASAGSLKRERLADVARGALDARPSSCAIFVLVGSAMAAFLPWGRSLLVVGVSPWSSSSSAFASRTRFVTEAGHTSPIVLVTVPALFLLPPPIVPLVTGLGFVVGGMPGVVTGRIDAGTAGGRHRQRLVRRRSGPRTDASPGPRPRPHTPIWILIAALAAQLAVDLAVSLLHEWVMLGTPSVLTGRGAAGPRYRQRRAGSNIRWVTSDDCQTPDGAARQLGDVDAVLVPGGFGVRGIEGKLGAIRYARENGIPLLGLCLGLQCAAIEVARDLAGLPGANSSEFDPDTPDPVIATMADQQDVVAGERDMGGTMRLGLFPAVLSEGSLVRELYGTDLVEERHRHRYEVNNAYRAVLEQAGLQCSGLSPTAA